MNFKEVVDCKFVKIHLVSYFRNYVQGFGNIQMYYTELGVTCHKTMIKEGYYLSNRNDASHQILQTYAILESFKIHPINVKANISCPIQDKLHKKPHKHQVGSATKQLRGYLAYRRLSSKRTQMAVSEPLFK